jgi:serine/threonine protein phosphatase PrpC
MEKPKVNRENNKSLNYTFDKADSSNKSKKNAPKMKNIKTVENTENIDNKENRVNPEIKQQEEIIKNEEIKKRKIEKIGCICHAGEISFGNPKINQDNYFNYKINTDDLVFMGVCDGHGENGHYVSEYLINHLPQDFNEAYIDLQQKEKKTFEDISLESITKTFEESFLKTDDDLNEFCSNMKKKKLIGENVPNYFNCDYSGSTCVSILLKQNDISKVYIANVGDSRTIVIRERDNNWTCKQLSRDHKPTEKDEYNRIIEADGEIEAIEDDNGNWTGPLRVWEKGSEGPGLAMTRSLGDKVGAKIGVVCTPEVFKYFIKEEDRAFIIASDGLWEYMNNQEVTNSVKELITNMRNNNENGEINADLISRELFNQSVERWRQKEQGIDDITIICVILN